MGLVRLLLLALLVYVIWRLIRHSFAGRRPTPAGDQAERMLRCAQCGLNVPERESLQREGRSFCSPEHHRAWLERQRD